jgi:hypothetical protein
MRDLLRIVDPGNPDTMWKDNCCRNHRSRQRSSTNFIEASDTAFPISPELTFPREKPLQPVPLAEICLL